MSCLNGLMSYISLKKSSNSNLSTRTALNVGVIFGANLVQHFIGRYSRYSRYRTALLKLEEIISALPNTKNAQPLGWAFFIISSMNRGANEAHLAVYEK